MKNLTFLNNDQVFGNNKLEVFEKRGFKAKYTDFATVCGYSNNGYWLSDKSALNTLGEHSFPNEKSVYGVRFVKIFDNIFEFFIRENVKLSLAKDDVLEAEYLYFPQSAIASCNLDSPDYNKYSVQMNANKNFSIKGPDEKIYHNGNYVPIKEEPIKWLVDAEKGTMVSEKILQPLRYSNYEKFLKRLASESYYDKRIDFSDCYIEEDVYDFLESNSLTKGHEKVAQKLIKK